MDAPWRAVLGRMALASEESIDSLSLAVLPKV
jgi:hypothetical protein